METAASRNAPRIAIVMPHGGRMEARRLNSMETVAVTLNRYSAFKGSTVFICEDGAESVAEPDATLRVPAGLSKKAHAAAVLKVLQAYRPDIVEFHQLLCTSAALAKRLPGARSLFFRHTRLNPPRNPLRRMKHWRRLRTFDHVVLVSQTAKDEFLADYPGFNSRAVVVSNPIDLAPWRGNANRKERLILFSGRALPEKGLDAFCEALAVVLDRAPEWRAALALGEWERSADWAETCIRPLERFGDRVEIHRSAPLAAVQAMNRRAAIAVTPSRVKEAMGLTAMEALAGGAALISSGRGGLREASGEHALYVDPPEAPSLVEAMLVLMGDDAAREAMARQGQDYVSQAHDPVVRAGELDQFRRNLLVGARRPAVARITPTIAMAHG